MPTTARIAIFSTDPFTGIENNVDYVQSTDTSRHERWSIFGGQEPVRIYWPVTGERNLFIQLWQPQPAVNDTVFKIYFPSSPQEKGWDCVVPAAGRIALLLRIPSETDILDIASDPFSVEADVVYF